MDESGHLPLEAYRPAHVFTLAEAQALVDVLAGILARTDGKVAELSEVQDMLADADAYWVSRTDSMPLAERTSYTKLTARLEELRSSLTADLEEIRSFGCELKDLPQGLVDFPALVEGKLAYLCWQRGEPRLAYWHSLEGGFAGRQPLPQPPRAER